MNITLSKNRQPKKFVDGPKRKQNYQQKTRAPVGGETLKLEKMAGFDPKVEDEDNRKEREKQKTDDQSNGDDIKGGV